MANRVISVVLEIVDKQSASEIWESFRVSSLFHGCMIKSIGNGDAFAEAEELGEKWQLAEEEYLDNYALEHIEEQMAKWRKERGR
jgi:hypothetical protein